MDPKLPGDLRAALVGRNVFYCSTWPEGRWQCGTVTVARFFPLVATLHVAADIASHVGGASALRGTAKALVNAALLLKFAAYRVR